MPDTATKRGVPVRDFNDAGTGESFTEGHPHGFEPGAFANYAAAGLIVEAAPETKAPAEPDA